MLTSIIVRINRNLLNDVIILKKLIFCIWKNTNFLTNAYGATNSTAIKAWFNTYLLLIEILRLSDFSFSMHPSIRLQEGHAPFEHVPLPLAFLTVRIKTAASDTNPNIIIIISSYICICTHLLYKQSSYLENNKRYYPCQQQYISYLEPHLLPACFPSEHCHSSHAGEIQKGKQHEVISYEWIIFPGDTFP